LAFVDGAALKAAGDGAPPASLTLATKARSEAPGEEGPDGAAAAAAAPETAKGDVGVARLVAAVTAAEICVELGGVEGGAATMNWAADVADGGAEAS
jgi:hypothetical protein